MLYRVHPGVVSLCSCKNLVVVLLLLSFCKIVVSSYKHRFLFRRFQLQIQKAVYFYLKLAAEGFTLKSGVQIGVQQGMF